MVLPYCAIIMLLLFCNAIGFFKIFSTVDNTMVFFEKHVNVVALEYGKHYG